MNNELSEVRRLLADLEAAFDRLKPSDRRFVLSWRQYIDRTSATAKIGPLRIEMLRRVWSEYCEAKTESEAA